MERSRRAPGAASPARGRILALALVPGMLAIACSAWSPRAIAGAGAPLAGKWRATRVDDGDTLVARGDDGRTLRVRLAGVDAPEAGQPFADRAREALAASVADRALTIRPVKTDAYGRTVADVYAGAIDVGLALVDAGLAWHFARYQHEQAPAQRADYARAERGARDARRGLWSDPSPLAPWLYRAQRPPGAPATRRGAGVP